MHNLGNSIRPPQQSGARPAKLLYKDSLGPESAPSARCFVAFPLWIVAQIVRQQLENSSSSNNNNDDDDRDHNDDIDRPSRGGSDSMTQFSSRLLFIGDRKPAVVWVTATLF